MRISAPPCHYGRVQRRFNPRQLDVVYAKIFLFQFIVEGAGIGADVHLDGIGGFGVMARGEAQFIYSQRLYRKARRDFARSTSSPVTAQFF